MEKSLQRVAPLPSEITPESTYHSRRDFLKIMGIVSAASLLAACGPQIGGPLSETTTVHPSNTPLPRIFDEKGDPANTYEQITSYNNYYEFSFDKEEVSQLAADFPSTPWSIEINGLVHEPRTFGLEDLLRLEQKERIYRLRCVEAWSMVIPWVGFELNEIIKLVEPMTSAKYVRFVTLMDEEQMPGQKNARFPWPYQEGLRLDEALHRLTLLATGIYGKPLPGQNGAPLRLVVPWKYGYKSIKSIVRIELTEEQPDTFWSTVASDEYGFYSNVNPEVSHPRWSQASERRIGELDRRPTMLFNGYAEEVADLYRGMDLGRDF